MEGRGEQNKKTIPLMLTWSYPLLMTADLNKKRDAAFCMVTLVFTRSSVAGAAFEYFI